MAGPYRFYNGGHPTQATAPGWADSVRGKWFAEYRNLSPHSGLPWQSYKRKWFDTEAAARRWIEANSDQRPEAGMMRTRSSAIPRYVVYVDGIARSRWDDRDEASLVAERAVAGRPDHRSGVKDTRTGKWVVRHDTRGAARNRPSHPDSRGERIQIAARLTRRSVRRRYRGR